MKAEKYATVPTGMRWNIKRKRITQMTLYVMHAKKNINSPIGIITAINVMRTIAPVAFPKGSSI